MTAGITDGSKTAPHVDVDPVSLARAFSEALSTSSRADWWISLAIEEGEKEAL
jgi:hypothetical protein